MRLLRLIVEACLICTAGVATLTGQTHEPDSRPAPPAPALAAGLSNSSAAAPAAGPGAVVSSVEYAGNTQCKTCHPGIWSSFYKNPHFKSLALGKEPPEKTACEGCHGPAKAHIAAGGGRNTIPHAFTIMQPREIIAQCLKCHATDFNRANIRRSEHTEHDIPCTACHSNHHSVTPRNLLARNQPDACYQCHGDVRSQFNMTSKHRVNEGMMVCSDCHNPHGGFTPTFGMGQTSKTVSYTHLTLPTNREV